MMLNRTGRVQQPFGFNVGLVCKLWRWVSTKINTLAFSGYSSLPVITSHNFSYTKIATTAIASCMALVLRVSSVSYITQVCNSIIRVITVYMVNNAIRINAVNVKPSKSMSHTSLIKNVHIDAPIFTFVTSNSASRVHTSANEPSKNASFRVVMQKLAELFCCNIRLSHDVVPYKQLIGQKPIHADNMAGLRYFNLNQLNHQVKVILL